MQVTSLSKVINLFLVGVPAALVYFFMLWQFAPVQAALAFCFQELGRLYGANKTDVLTAAVQIGATMLFLGIGAFCGTLTQGAANIMRDRLATIWKSRAILFLLGATRHRDHYEDYRKALQAQLKDSDEFGRSVGDLDTGKASGVSERWAPKTGVAILFQWGNSTTVQWGVEHNAMHLLAWEFLVLLCGVESGYLLMRWHNLKTLAAGYSGLGQDLGVTGVILFAGYLLLREAVTNYYYSYETAYRAALMIQWDDARKKLLHTPTKKIVAG